MDKIVIAAAAFAAGYYLSKQSSAAPAAVGASWRCINNPTLPGCDPVRNISWRCINNPTAAGCKEPMRSTTPKVAILPMLKTSAVRGMNYTPSFDFPYSM